MSTSRIGLLDSSLMADGFVRHRCRVVLPDGKHLEPYVDVEQEQGYDHPSLGGFALALTLMFAECGDRLIVEGAIPSDLAANMEEISCIWHCWLPKTYRPLRVECHAVAPTLRTRPEMVFAYSGGVDSTSALLRHSARALSHRTRKVGAAALIQGFDIPLERGDFFDDAFSRGAPALQTLSVPLVRVRTNMKHLGLNWEHSFMLLLVGALSQMSSRYGGVVAGSCGNYADFSKVWGSNPILNPWLSCAEFAHYTDGHDISRIQKLEVIAGNPTLLSSLRVCYSNDSGIGNCGRCEKCLRTMLAMDAIGCLEAGRFVSCLSQAAVRSLQPKNSAQWLLLQQIVDYCQFHAARPWWIGDLRRVLKRGYGPSVFEQTRRRIIALRIRLGLRTRLKGWVGQ